MIRNARSAAVGAARKFATGKITYNKYKPNPKTGKKKKIVMTVELPYQNKKLLSLLNRRANAVGAIKGTSKAAVAKRAVALERLRDTTEEILNEFVDAMRRTCWRYMIRLLQSSSRLPRSGTSEPTVQPMSWPACTTSPTSRPQLCLPC